MSTAKINEPHDFYTQRIAHLQTEMENLCMERDQAWASEHHGKREYEALIKENARLQAELDTYTKALEAERKNTKSLKGRVQRLEKQLEQIPVPHAVNIEQLGRMERFDRNQMGQWVKVAMRMVTNVHDMPIENAIRWVEENRL